MNIAFVTTYNAKDVINWSGLGYYISKSLEDNSNTLNYIGNLKMQFSSLNFLKKVYYTKLLHKSFPLERTVYTAKAYSKTVSALLSDSKYDCVFSPGTLPVAYLETSAPKVIYTDATFACMLNYYESSAKLSTEIIRQAHELEAQALKSCSLAIYASEWAAKSAVEFYGIEASKVKVVPFGANLDSHYSKEEVNKFIYTKQTKTLKILFNGVDWRRKGGDLVLSTIREVKKRGLSVELHVVGLSELPFTDVPDFVINHGFLKKSIPAQKAALENLYKSCHFLFLPSKAEAFGCVFCEASAFGVPSFARNTGGVSTAISNGKNGFILDASAGVQDYADMICHYFLDQQKYISLSLSSYHEYETRLNWKSIGEAITKLIREI